MGDPASAPKVRTFIGLFSLLAALLFGGMAAGLAIALLAAGGSVGAIVIGFGFLPVVLLLGLSAWRGIATAWLVTGLGRALWRSRGDGTTFREATRQHMRGADGVIPGTAVFVPVAAAVSLVAAGLMALAADGSPLTAGVVTLAAGLAYGVLLRRLARAGLLLPPEG